MDNEFTAVMANRSDRELIAIVTTERGKYQQHAIEAAETEIARRGIPATQHDELRQQQLDEIQRQFDFESRKVDGGTRFLHLIVDSIVIAIIAIIAFVLLLIAGFQIEESSVFPVFVYLFVFLGYYICMECAWQQTVGKMITKTKVVTSTDDVPTNGDIVARSFCRLIPFDRLSFLFTRNGFHDSISKTSVIRK